MRRWGLLLGACLALLQGCDLNPQPEPPFSSNGSQTASGGNGTAEMSTAGASGQSPDLPVGNDSNGGMQFPPLHGADAGLSGGEPGRGNAADAGLGDAGLGVQNLLPRDAGPAADASD